MLRVSGFSTYLIAALLAILVIAMPAGAYNVALYGSNSGFNPAFHNDSVMVIQSVPGSPGSNLDNTINQFIQPSVDVIILGGDDSFNASTAAKIESAVATGKFLWLCIPAAVFLTPACRQRREQHPGSAWKLPTLPQLCQMRPSPG